MVLCSLESPGFKQFLLWEGVVVLKELILTVSTLQGCGSLERTDFNSFYFGEGVAWSRKNWILTVSTFGKVWWC